MAKKNEKTVSEDSPMKGQSPYNNEEIFDLESLWKMKFQDPASGQIVMVRKAFKPRGKLEFYTPEY